MAFAPENYIVSLLSAADIRWPALTKRNIDGPGDLLGRVKEQGGFIASWTLVNNLGHRSIVDITKAGASQLKIIMSKIGYF